MRKVYENLHVFHFWKKNSFSRKYSRKYGMHIVHNLSSFLKLQKLIDIIMFKLLILLYALTLDNSLIQEKKKKKFMWIEVENVWLTDAQRWADRSLLSNFVWAIRCALPNPVTTTGCMHIRVHIFKNFLKCHQKIHQKSVIQGHTKLLKQSWTKGSCLLTIRLLPMTYFLP